MGQDDTRFSSNYLRLSGEETIPPAISSHRFSKMCKLPSSDKLKPIKLTHLRGVVTERPDLESLLYSGGTSDLSETPFQSCLDTTFPEPISHSP